MRLTKKYADYLPLFDAIRFWPIFFWPAYWLGTNASTSCATKTDQ